MRIVRVRAIIPFEHKFLFVKHAPDSEYWALPGGKLESNETLENGIVREIIEELGVKPCIGRLLYVQQFFKGTDESLEFFFEVLNGADYEVIDLSKTTHGTMELSQAAFIDPRTEYVLPTFLSAISDDLKRNDLPVVTVSS